MFVLGKDTALPYRHDVHTIVTTLTFERQARQAGLSDDEVAEVVSWLAANVLAGDLIVGTGGARKVRFARPGAGKSGGYRAIHYFGGEDIPVFLLAVIDKGKRANLSKAERNQLAALLPRIAEAYRAGVARRLVELKEL